MKAVVLKNIKKSILGLPELRKLKCTMHFDEDGSQEMYTFGKEEREQFDSELKVLQATVNHILSEN